MLPNEIGRFSIERAAFHEAAHFVCVLAKGGNVRAMSVVYDDALREWQVFDFVLFQIARVLLLMAALDESEPAAAY